MEHHAISCVPYIRTLLEAAFPFRGLERVHLAFEAYPPGPDSWCPFVVAQGLEPEMVTVPGISHYLTRRPFQR